MAKHFFFPTNLRCHSLTHHEQNSQIIDKSILELMTLRNIIDIYSHIYYTIQYNEVTRDGKNRGKRHIENIESISIESSVFSTKLCKEFELK